MKKIILIIVLIALVFYHIYPQALPTFGFTFIVTSGALGLFLYLRQGAPYGEVISIMLPYAFMGLWTVFCIFVNNRGDSFFIDMSKSQLGWFFSAYLIVYIFYLAHPKGGLDKLLYYIIGAVFLQCVISVAMYQNEAIGDFFNSIQKLDQLALSKREETEGKRLLGYGAAFFGAGIACGMAMILVVYLVMTKKLNIFQLLFAAFVYSGIFYIGLLSARTTLVGGGASIALAVILLFTRNTQKSQLLSYILFCVVLLTIGYSLCYVYFPDFADWAFEAFINYQESGEFRTKSSDGLTSGVFMVPPTFFNWVFGEGHGHYFGVDVGLTRLLYWIGLPGTLLFFYFLYVVMKFSITKNRAFNLTLLVLYAYNLALNWKGLSDLNYVTYIVTFYFLHYKYYIYTPYLYKLGLRDKTKLRYAFQTPPTGRRV